jgi:hypothetical protein
VMDLVQVVPV